MPKNLDAPKISVIIPVFNAEKYIARCLESVVNQSIKQIEIIIINDMSTDNSEKVISEYVKKYDFIKYFKMQSRGLPGGARNLGLANVTGKYISFVDSDDWIDTMMFATMLNLIEKANADIAVCGVITEHESVYESVNRYEYKLENVIDGKMALELLTRRYNQDISISSIVCNKIYRTQFITENNYSFLENNYNDDDVFNFLCFLSADKVAITPHTYYHYYQRWDSIMHVFSKKYFDDFIEAFCVIKNDLHSKNIYELYRDNYYSFFEKCLASILNILAAAETNLTKQNDYMHYLFTQCQDALILPDYIEYVGFQRVKNFLTPTFKRD